MTSLDQRESDVLRVAAFAAAWCVFLALLVAAVYAGVGLLQYHHGVPCFEMRWLHRAGGGK